MAAIRLPRSLRSLQMVSTDTIVAGGESIREAIEHLFQEHSNLRGRILTGSGSLCAGVAIFLNGTNTAGLAEGLETSIQPSDIIEIVTAIAGG